MIPRGFLSGAICGGLTGLALCLGAAVVAGLSGGAVPAPVVAVPPADGNSASDVEPVPAAEAPLAVAPVPESDPPANDENPLEAADKAVDTPLPAPVEPPREDEAIAEAASDPVVEPTPVFSAPDPVTAPDIAIQPVTDMAGEEPVENAIRAAAPDVSATSDSLPAPPEPAGATLTAPEVPRAPELADVMLDAPAVTEAARVDLGGTPEIVQTLVRAVPPLVETSVTPPRAPNPPPRALPRDLAALPPDTAEARPQTRRLGASGGSLIDRRKDVVAEKPAEPTPAGPADDHSAFDNPDNKPLLSVVLIDERNSASGALLEQLASASFRISVALDPALPDAADRAELMTAQGVDVLALLDLPENLTAADTEVALGAALRRLPKAVGIFEGAATGLQGNPAMAEQAAAIAAAEGLGVIWQAKGLGSAHKAALRQGVPSHLLFRDVDGDDKSARIIRRFLDNAAFRAGQQGALVITGRLRPEMVEALLVWQTQSRAGRVIPAPVSALFAQSP